MNFSLFMSLFLWLFLATYLIYLIIFVIGFFLPRKYFTDETPKISVIVAARNEEQNIERCIQALCTQTYPLELFEVIIVNDQSEDNTESIVKNLQSEYKNLKLENLKNRPEDYAPKKYAINEALKISSGEIILTTDADITVKSTWIESIVSCFEKKVGLVVGFSSIRKIQTKKFFQKFEALDFLMLMTATKGSLRVGIPISCSGQNLAFRKTAFEEVGGFGEKNKTQSADDVLLLHLMRRSKKWQIAFADDEKAYVETDATQSLSEFLKQRIRWAAMGVGQFSKSINLSILNIATAVVNISIFLFMLYLLIIFEFNFLLMAAFIAKFLVELLIAVTGTIYFRKLYLLWFFPFLFIFYMPYILIISIFSLFGNFKWKERVYKKGVFEAKDKDE